MALRNIKKADMSFRFNVAFQSKVWPSKFPGGVNKSLKFALSKIGVNNYMDSYLLHAPADTIEKNITAWKQLIDCQTRGQTKRIGLGDFTIEVMDALFEATGRRPDVLQLPISLSNMHFEYISYCQENSIELQSYRPLEGWEKYSGNKILVDLAAKYGTTIKNLISAFFLNLGITVILLPESKGEIGELIKAKSLILSKEDLDLIKSITQ
ncbi:aldo/keto reductase family oxidoreductase [Mycoplasma haemofelis str. Langford 1]|uniref:Aldo/keto reductase family oxidoreductase n=1 Tax=Mycoplasma haemofelis (strain Langford 1) TaxID=941640 RepID=E8ZIW9_MYCHL|nr:aldo/keto reductase [Mycoplasma haemofelis]CBY93090.1 aldo/keto reductase family oxidoreductase [Mycoplasma haemofelis str. Langford 1]